MRVSIGHVTRYTYAEPTGYSIQSLRLTPPSFHGQRVIEWRVSAPGIDKATSFRDGFGNFTQLCVCTGNHSEVLIIAKGVVETEDRAGVVKGIIEAAPPRIFLRDTEKTRASPGLADLAQSARADGTLAGMHRLMAAVAEAVIYKIGSTTAHTSAAEALAAGEGVCQDHAHVFIAAARTLGVPARYVCGYFYAGGDEPSEAHHAWAEVWIDGLGWVGFDPANGMCPTERYVRLATGLDAMSAAPIRGARRGSSHEELDVIVEVQQQNSQQ